MSDLEELLSRLPSAAETQQPATFEGRAVSRDDEHLHLATRSGVVAIPLADIEEVQTLSGRSNDPHLVSVNVRHGGGIKQIHSVAPMQRGAGGFGPFGGLGGLGGTFSEGDTVTGSYLDTSTVTGGRADATDDTFWVEQVDDQPA